VQLKLSTDKMLIHDFLEQIVHTTKNRNDKLFNIKHLSHSA
jgi:hypothetical protein